MPLIDTHATEAKFTLRKIIQPLLQDLQRMESHGVETDGQLVEGSLIHVCGDDFFSHQIGGFRECLSSGPIFRYCLAPREQISEKWHEDDFISSERKIHARHINFIESDSNRSIVCGGNVDGCLSSLELFDVTKGLSRWYA